MNSKGEDQKEEQMTRRGNLNATLCAVAVGLALALGAGTAAKADSKPQYGGTLEVGTYFVTLTALSWDNADWNWKLNHDAGQLYEQLFAGDLSKAARNGGKYRFTLDAWLPSDALR